MSRIIKRLFDIIFSGIFIIVFLPFFIIISFIIKLDSKGPVIFKQKRLGKNGNVFNIFKFRTMVLNAEKIGDGLSIKTDDDTRITTIGRFLRKYSIDELPQLINVFIGNMSLVGPRPPVIYHPYNDIENYLIWAKKRFEMRPDIT